MEKSNIESIDDMALRLSEQCRDIINEGLVLYFGQVLMEGGQRVARVVKKVPAARAPYVQKPTGRGKTSKPRRLMTMLKEDGPQLATDLERELDLPTRAALYTAVGMANKILKEQGKTIKRQKGSLGKGHVYAIRTIGGEDGKE